MSDSDSDFAAVMTILPDPDSIETFLDAAKDFHARVSPSATETENGRMVSDRRVLLFQPGELSKYIRVSLRTLLRTPVLDLSNALVTLDVRQHSLAYATLLLSLLYRTTEYSESDWEWLQNCVAELAAEADPSILELAPKVMADICHAFTDKLIDRGSPLCGMSIVRAALDKMSKTKERKGVVRACGGDTTCVLTSAHSDLCKLALALRCFTSVLPLLTDATYMELSREARLADPKFILLFFYYGGMILAAIKNYTRALEYFELCLTTPSDDLVSVIMVEATKKYMLLRLIKLGSKNRKDEEPWPKKAPYELTKALPSLTKPYRDLMKEFYSIEEGSFKKLRSVAKDPMFVRDGNAGLVEQVLVAKERRKIFHFCQSYLTASISNVASCLGMGSTEAERMVNSMVSERTINAKISQKDGFISFDVALSDCADDSSLHLLMSSIEKCVQLDEIVERIIEEFPDNKISACPLMSLKHTLSKTQKIDRRKMVEKLKSLSQY